MKTSNKILLTAFILVIATPLLMVMALKRKIKNHDYTTSYSGPLKNRMPGNFSVLQISGSIDVNIIRDDSNYAEYPQYDLNSFRFRFNGDTLRVSRKAEDTLKPYERPLLYLTMHLKYPHKFIVNQSSLTLAPDEYYKSHDLDFFLIDNASLTITGNVGERNYDEESGRYADDTIPPICYQKLAIYSDGAEVQLSEKVCIKNVVLNAMGNSSINIDSTASFSNVVGSISDKTMVQSKWNFSRNLKSSDK